MSYEDIKHWERPVMGRLLELALEDPRHSISVFDCEEWTLKNSRDMAAIKAALSTTDDDTIRVMRDDGTHMGSFWCIYNNGSEDDPMILISDYSVTDWAEATVKQLTAEFEHGVSGYYDRLMNEPTVAPGIALLEANLEDGEGSVVVTDEFKAQTKLMQADLLKDWIAQLTEMYNETLTGEIV